MKNSHLKGNIMLLLAAIIWGTAFVAQSVGMDFVDPLTFNAARFFVGGFVLLPAALLLKRSDGKPSAKKIFSKHTLFAGLCCGVAIFVASTLQQYGVVYTTAGKAAFITTLYITMVPILGIFLRKKIKAIVWGSIIIAVIGMYMLCVKEDFSINIGDLLCLACALCFSVHILLIDKFSRRVDSIGLSCIQFFVGGLISSILMFIFETPDMQAVLNCAIPILYAGALSSGVAFTLQIIAQKSTEPAIASLLMSLEAVFAAVAGWMILGEVLSPREAVGCVFVLAAVLLAQFPVKNKAD